MILCDTNILIEFFKRNPKISQELHQIGPAQIAISAITRAELYFGAINKRELSTIKRHLSTLTNFPISPSVSNRFIILMEAYSLSHKLSLPDALIAATAIEHQLALYTLNLKDFRFISNLTIYQPLTY